MDPRIARAQELHAQVSMLRQHDSQADDCTLRERSRELATLHRDLAAELLSQGNPDGLPDLYAAITAWAEIGCVEEAHSLIQSGREFAEGLPNGRTEVLRQLDELVQWLRALPAPRTLSELARSFPALPGMSSASEAPSEPHSAKGDNA